MTTTRSWAATARSLMEHCLTNPTGFNGNDPQVENAYLRNLGESYIDTVARVGVELDAETSRLRKCSKSVPCTVSSAWHWRRLVAS